MSQAEVTGPQAHVCADAFWAQAAEEQLSFFAKWTRVRSGSFGEQLIAIHLLDTQGKTTV